MSLFPVKILGSIVKMKRRVFIYSDESSNFQEINSFWKKSSFLLILAFILGIGIMFLSGEFYSHSSLQNSIVERENESLKLQLDRMSEQFSLLSSKVEKISAQGNQLRSLVDLPLLDKNELRSSTGGNSEILNNSIDDLKNPSLKHSIENSIELKHQIDIQQQSFEEVKAKISFNNKLFSAIPSLKPMEGYYSPTGFGIRMHPVLGVYKTHVGLDIINKVGTSIYSAGDGVVEFVGRNNGGYGIMVEINHGFGYKTLYAHCSKILVREGQHIKRGDIIAKSGKTGLVTGPHLHYEVSLNGVNQNPVDFFYDNISPTVFHHRSIEKK